MRVLRWAATAAVGLATAVGSAVAQTPAPAPAPPPPAPTPLAVGTMAPDFTLPAATRAGASGTVHLADLKGKTVVLAFFYKARTRG